MQCLHSLSILVEVPRYGNVRNGSESCTNPTFCGDQIGRFSPHGNGSGHCVAGDAGRMKGRSARAVVDLVTAAGSGGGDEGFGIEFLHMRQENQRSDVHGDLIVLLFITERAGHAATAGRDFLHGVVLR